MSLAFIMLMRRYPGQCSLVACINLTLIFLVCDFTLITEFIS